MGQVAELNASGRWKLGVDSEVNGAWSSKTVTANTISETQVKIQAEGMILEANRISDGGYVDDGSGVKSAGGQMVEFDIDPSRSSWEKRSQSFRPGLGAPALPRGWAIYDTGQESILVQMVFGKLM